MEDCIFCAIAQGEVPSRKVLEDDETLAFYDQNPQAPVHVLVIPKRHIASLVDVEGADRDLLGTLTLRAAEVARMLGLGETGFRLVVNVGRDGLQTVGHLHLHILGGRPMGWPPG